MAEVDWEQEVDDTKDRIRDTALELLAEIETEETTKERITGLLIIRMLSEIKEDGSISKEDAPRFTMALDGTHPLTMIELTRWVLWLLTKKHWPGLDQIRETQEKDML